MNENNDEIETIVYEGGGAFLARIARMDQAELRLICKVCGADVIFAPTYELAKKYKVGPGAYCSKDRNHLTSIFRLKDD